MLGVQRPRVASLPPFASSAAGEEAVELAHLAGLHLDPWEEFVLVNSLNEREDGRYAAFEVAACVPRQNGKGSILEARELAGLFLLGEQMITHSAHQFDTSLEAFRRLLFLIEETPDLAQQVHRISRSHGEEGIELKNGNRIRFRTRTKGGGRGFSGDLVILDEAMILPEATLGALMPTLSARSVSGNPQLWYTGSAVDQNIHDDGMVFARVRERGLKGGDPALMYVEWSADAATPESVDEALATNMEAWAQANPGLGIRISAEHIAREQRSMDPRTFAVERLGVGSWPRADGAVGGIDFEAFSALTDPQSSAQDPICLAFDVRPDRSSASVAVAGVREDGHFHIEVIDRRKGTGWVVPRLEELVEKHDPAGLVCDGASPAASLLPQLEAAGLDVQTVAAKEYAQACGHLFDTVEQANLRHLGTTELMVAVKGAAKRPLGDAWAWSRKSSAIDISPLVACTLALWQADVLALGTDQPLVEVFG